MPTRVGDFDFALPDALIAQEAVARGMSRLMIVDRHAGTWRHGSIGDLPTVLVPGDLLVVNDTRVFPARLLGRRVPSGGGIECFLLQRRGNVWDALMSPAQKLQIGSRIVIDDAARAPGVSLRGEIVGRGERGHRTVKFTVGVDSASDDAVDAAIDALGHVPLPPYIKRDDRPDDRERYQTVYADARGSVAAPTAGLHFTDELLRDLAARGIERAAVTLHVGYGTFKPVKAELVEDHHVDPEPYVVSGAAAALISRTRGAHGRVIAVGTTTTRALEHAVARGGVRAGAGIADNFIHAGHHFAAIDGMLTNFHLPKSSLLMLVTAFGGHDLIMRAYRDAVAHGYRFYSYGDCMVIT